MSIAPITIFHAGSIVWKKVVGNELKCWPKKSIWLIPRKETRESIYWLDMVKEVNQNLSSIQLECDSLIKEGKEIVKILTSSIITLENKNS